MCYSPSVAANGPDSWGSFEGACSRNGRREAGRIRKERQEGNGPSLRQVGPVHSWGVFVVSECALISNQELGQRALP